MSLFPNLAPLVAPPGIDLRLGDVREMLASVRGARLIVADPPWQYSVGAEGKGKAQPELNGIYECMSDADIAAILNAAYDAAAPDARLAVWTTHPKLMEWIRAGHADLRPQGAGGGATLPRLGSAERYRP